jgi:hypothetical protein
VIAIIVFAAIAIGFVWAGRSEADARSRRIGYHAGSLTPPRRDPPDDSREG